MPSLPQKSQEELIGDLHKLEPPKSKERNNSFDAYIDKLLDDVDAYTTYFRCSVSCRTGKSVESFVRHRSGNTLTGERNEYLISRRWNLYWGQYFTYTLADASSANNAEGNVCSNLYTNLAQRFVACVNIVQLIQQLQNSGTVS